MFKLSVVIIAKPQWSSIVGVHSRSSRKGELIFWSFTLDIKMQFDVN